MSWEDMKSPKLRRLPSKGFRIHEYLGSGRDGLAFKAEFDDIGIVALKIVSHSHDSSKATMLTSEAHSFTTATAQRSTRRVTSTLGPFKGNASMLPCLR